MKIIFFDNDCGLCLWCVRFVLKHDKKRQFYFAPLTGTTASQKLPPLNVDSLVLLEEGKVPLYYSKAVFTILWELGFPWNSIGLLSFLPRPFLFPFDLGYRLVAKLRRRLCSLQDFKNSFTSTPDRLLP